MVAVSRRQCLRLVAAGAAAGALPSIADLAAPPPIVDTHQHLWDLKTLKLAWVTSEPLLSRSFTPADYRQASADLNIERAIYMEVGAAAEQRVEEVAWIRGVMDRKEGKTVAAVIGGNPGDAHFRSYVDQFKSDPRIKGVRGALPDDAANNTHFIDGLRYLGSIGWRFDLSPDPTKLAECRKVVASCHLTRFVLDHCGNASTTFYSKKNDPRRKLWEEGIAALADYGNVACKISGVCEAGPPELAKLEFVEPIVSQCMRFGDRTMFASNWPVCLKSITLKDWVEMVRAIFKSQGEAVNKAIFRDNAVKFYELGAR